jgi:acyl carrier protein
MNQYLEKIISLVIEKTGMDREDVTDSSYFEDDLNIGEIDLLEIISALEEEYEIEFTEEEKEKIESIMDLVEIVVEKVD